MTDYLPLLQRAVEGLEKSTGESRRALYERARTALVAQLRGLNPPLSESEITRERLALEEAVRKVEADAARRMRDESGARAPAAPEPPPPPEPPAPPPAAVREPRAAAPSRSSSRPERNRMKSDRPPFSAEGLKGFRDVVAEAEGLGDAAAQATRSARETFANMPGSNRDDGRVESRIEPRVDSEALRTPARERNVRRVMERSRRAPEPEPPPPLPPVSDFAPPQEEPEAEPRRRAPGPMPRRGEYDREHSNPARRGLIAALSSLLVLALVAGTAYWQRERISGLFGVTRSMAPTPKDAGPARAKITDRVGQNGQPETQGTGQAPASQDQKAGQPVPAVAQRVVLYEEDPNNPEGNRYVGSALWRTETVSPGPGQSPELAVRADVEIPDRKLAMTFSIRRNTDKALPASHTVEITFNVPADNPFGGVANVPGLLMKDSEQTRGAPLSGLAVKVTNNFFLVGLSSAESDLQRNLQLLKERGWFDVPIVYGNGRRAILAVEKGNPGERAFAEAFKAWKQ
ncbi:MAG: hypothetical protein AB7O60_17570 [Variibacter sp.]